VLSADADVAGVDDIPAARGGRDDAADGARTAAPRHPCCTDDTHAVAVSMLCADTPDKLATLSY